MNLAAFGPDIWTADGPDVAAFGPIKLPTRMIVVKLGDGSLWINSPIEASPPEMAHVAQLGPIRHLVAPTPLHVWRLAAWKKHFPDALVWEPRDLRTTPPAWAGQLDVLLFEGNLFIAEAEFFHTRSRTLIMTDFVQNYPSRPHRPWLNAMTRLAGVQGGGVPLDIRLTFLQRARARRSLRAMLAWDFDKLIVAHGDCIEHAAKPFVMHAFRWL
ncbi:MAG TPA: DUF4336 domain-containing protein [Candidatus Acidoferrum sp.]|nr:DUF4336 domain-containing protein [Candidatus Acidoferrum sp.]